MILVDDLPIAFPTDASSPSLSHHEEGFNLLLSLLQHPSLVSASSLLTSTPERSARQLIGHHKQVYVFQREYATVDPQLVQFIGTDEATTCVGFVIRNRESGMTSLAHLDSPSCVDYGLIQMMSLVLVDERTPLDVHLVGGFKDADDKKPESDTGYSFRLCSKIIEALQSSRKEFHLQTLCVLGHNTRMNSSGHYCPAISGFVVETSSGMITPTSFDINSRCPDELVRRLRVIVSSEDPSWEGKLLDTYDSRLDRFNIAPCIWDSNWPNYAKQMLQLSNSEFLLQGSTSPFAEAPDFVETQRRVFSYLVKYPDWRQTFSKRKPRIFKRMIEGWTRCNN